MPVPVPPISKPVAHPVFKLNSGEWAPNFIDPAVPWKRASLHPSTQTRDKCWGMSLEGSCETRYAEHRRNLSCFRNGLADAENASAIKGAPAEACIPPVYAPVASGQPLARMSDITPPNPLQFGGLKPVHGHHLSLQFTHHGYDFHCQESVPTELHHIDQRGQAAFMAALNDQRRDPAHEDAGTPFSDFVDCAMTSSQGYHRQELSTEPIFPTIADRPQQPAPAPEATNTGAPVEYRKLAQPLAEWMANYVWKVCTTGLSLPPTYVEALVHPVPIYPALPPSYLSSSIHSLLLSTLLQPSAVFLAIWYIVRLPVYYGAVPLPSDRVKEAKFRVALLGDPQVDVEKETLESSAPFRLVVLGAMLANKWLDDHTFSNKTWHTISHIPIQALNKLEALALDIFGYDLSVPAYDWAEWLEHIHSYHLALSSPVHPQPISRPSANPHHLVRRVIAELVNSPATRDAAAIPQPVFIGLEQRRQEKLRESALEAEVMEIDLDEDGPLREEYMLKRRISNSASYQNTVTSGMAMNDGSSWDRYRQGSMKSLPPPAKWSPGADEPILRSRNKISGHYAPVQPTVHSVTSYSAAFYQPIEFGYPHWNSATYAPNKTQPGYFVQPEAGHGATYNSYQYSVSQSGSIHSRSQSFSFEQENAQARQHMRSQSQARCEYECSNIRLTANQHLTNTQQNASSWGLRSNWNFGTSAFAPIHNIPYPSTWLRI